MRMRDVYRKIANKYGVSVAEIKKWNHSLLVCNIGSIFANIKIIYDKTFTVFY